jgi:hypothetical protein
MRKPEHCSGRHYEPYPPITYHIDTDATPGSGAAVAAGAGLAPRQAPSPSRGA